MLMLDSFVSTKEDEDENSNSNVINQKGGGDKNNEEKLKLITLAYTQLKNTYREKIDT